MVESWCWAGVVRKYDGTRGKTLNDGSQSRKPDDNAESSMGEADEQEQKNAEKTNSVDWQAAAAVAAAVCTVGQFQPGKTRLKEGRSHGCARTRKR